MPARVAIVGGGITGLAAAFHLERLTSAEIDLYEASDSLGGKLRTQEVNDFLVEEGPDSFFTRKPGVMELVQELGLESQVVEPLQSEFFMLVGGKLCRVPRELVRFKVTAETLEHADFLTAAGKARALVEPTQPPGTRGDESIHSFFTRRFGEEFSRLVAEPLLAGTHGGNAGQLGMRALYPGYLELERKHGSFAAAFGNAPSTDSGKPTFLSFKNGMGFLPKALLSALQRTRIHLNARVISASELIADLILLCVPSTAAAKLIGGETSVLLKKIEHRSSAIVTVAFETSDVGNSLNGTGFLVPSGESEFITGSTWSSRKWPSRAPDNSVLLRVFLGGERDELMKRADADLVDIAMRGVGPLLEIGGKPLFSKATRWIDALPQYEVGHMEKIAGIEKAISEYPKIRLAGTSYRGVGVPDCLSQARTLAEAVAGELN